MSTAVSERRTYPIYILLDVSASMRQAKGKRVAPQNAFTKLIPDLILRLADTPSLAAAAWISVIAFSDQAELLSPMTSLVRPIQIRAPRSGTETNYAAALAFLAARLVEDVRLMKEQGRMNHLRTTVARPLVFFITDGAPYVHDAYQHPSEWRPYRDRLTVAPTEARIAAIGLVGAHGGTLFALATGKPGGERNAFIADQDADGEALALSIVNVIERSIKLSVRAGDMVIDEPAGMRRVHG